MKKTLSILAVMVSGLIQAQVPEPTSSFKKTYLATVSESILSLGNLGSTQTYIDGPLVSVPAERITSQPIPRFSAFLHFGEQIHMLDLLHPMESGHNQKTNNLHLGNTQILFHTEPLHL